MNDPLLDGVVMIVDDNPSNLMILMDLLKLKGFQVLIAPDGVTATELAASAQPDLILLDVLMPEIDGFETCRRLKSKASTADIPVIFMSALSDAVDKITGFEVGAVDYITKPIEHHEVLARVRTHILLRQQRLEIQHLHDQDVEYFATISKMKDDLFSTATHDLKNPLASIKNSLYLLQRHGRVDDEKGQKYIEMIETSSEQMLQLITDLLEIARSATGLRLKRRDLDLTAFLQSQVDAWVAQANDKNITLEYIPLATDLRMSFDPSRMNQVIANLLSNAIKYSPIGGHVTVTVKAEGKCANILVKDTGYGIPHADLPHIFDHFYRVEQDEHLAEEGTGLGLSIVKAIIEMHNGEIQVESAPGQGTEFVVTLPVFDDTQ